MAYTLTTALSTGASGQTLSAQLVDTTGANVGGAVTTGFVDLGGGYYAWTYAGFPDGFRGAVKFTVGGVLQTIVAINPQEAENLDIKVSSRAAVLGGAASYVGPVAASGNVQVVRGDDYAAADGRALQWTINGAFPTLTTAGLSFVVNGTVTGTPSLVSQAAGQVVVQVELTAAQTNGFAAGPFAIRATVSGRVITLLEGQLGVQS